MAEFGFERHYVNHQGLNLRVSDLENAIDFASATLNSQNTKQPGIEKRKGYQAFGPSLGGFGTFVYNRVDPVTGVASQQVLLAGKSLYRITTAQFAVVYSGAALSCKLSIFFDTATSQYRATIIADGVTLYNRALGMGFDEASTVTIQTVITEIAAIAGFGLTTLSSGDGTSPAAFTKIVRDFELKSGAFLGTTGNIKEVNVAGGLATPFQALSDTYNLLGSDFENVSSCEINNVIYFAHRSFGGTAGTANGNVDYGVWKYDGQTLCNAGVLAPASVTWTEGAAGNVNGNVQYVVQFVSIDAIGNIITGNPVFSSTLGTANKQLNVSISGVPNNNGIGSFLHNVNCGIANGAQAGVTTINVNNGAGGNHTLKVGDTAYFFDGVSSSYVTRKITATTASSITIAGAAVNVSNGAVISNNLRIRIYRCKGTSVVPPIAWYLVDEIPANAFAASATQVYVDNKADASLADAFVQPATDRSPPRACKYLSAFQGYMIQAGLTSDSNGVAYSDVESAEYVPNNLGIDVDSGNGSYVRGVICDDQEIFVFKSRGIKAISGDLLAGNIRVRDIPTDLGLVSHASLVKIRQYIFFCSDRGLYKMAGGGVPAPVGALQLASPIEPVFTSQQVGLSPSVALRFQGAVAYHDLFGEKYVLYIPAETTGAPVTRKANSSSRTFAFDYTKNAWHEWSNINMAGGAVQTIDGETYFTECDYSTFSSVQRHVLYRRHTLNDAYAYQDNASAIPWVWQTEWECAGRPKELKRFIELMLYSTEKTPNSAFNLTLSTEINYAAGTLHTQNQGSIVSPDATLRLKLARGRTTAIRIKFSNSTPQQNVDLSGWELKMILPYKPDFKP